MINYFQNIANLKLIISRLTSNNNDMLAILASKASVEDLVKKLESENLKLGLNLEANRQRNLQLESKVRQNESEASRMHRIIRYKIFEEFIIEFCIVML